MHKNALFFFLKNCKNRLDPLKFGSWDSALSHLPIPSPIEKSWRVIFTFLCVLQQAIFLLINSVPVPEHSKQGGQILK